jgi:hypothetical protein
LSHAEYSWLEADFKDRPIAVEAKAVTLRDCAQRLLDDNR